MDENKIKDSFQKVKQDFSDLKYQLDIISNEIFELKNIISELKTNKQTNKPTNQQENDQYQPDNKETPTEELNELSNLSLEGLKDPNLSFSTGNKGVPTNKQTNQQTNRQTELIQENSEKSRYLSRLSNIEHISQTLNSLDSIKKELRYQFKQLTPQEFLVFSTIYQLENEGFTVDYPLIAEKLKLSESSIRDYVIKINKKQVPILKIKQKNKKIFLKIPDSIKQLASLQTLIALREL